MIHDQDLLDRLNTFRTERFDGEVFRATRIAANPTAPAINGGRWAPPTRLHEPEVSVLYASLERDGALAEVASFLLDLTPVPGPRPIKVTRLAVSTARTLRLARHDLPGLGVDPARYGKRDYRQTQKIGAALVFLGLDGLIAPSARWPCDNLMVFSDNHALEERLEPIASEKVEWRSWARERGLITPSAE